jgi:hypothetical protein
MSQASDQRRLSIQTIIIPRCRMKLQPGQLSSGGIGNDIKHTSYNRHIRKLKGLTEICCVERQETSYPRDISKLKGLIEISYPEQQVVISGTSDIINGNIIVSYSNIYSSNDNVMYESTTSVGGSFSFIVELPLYNSGLMSISIKDGTVDYIRNYSTFSASIDYLDTTQTEYLLTVNAISTIENIGRRILLSMGEKRSVIDIRIGKMIEKLLGYKLNHLNALTVEETSRFDIYILNTHIISLLTLTSDYVLQLGSSDKNAELAGITYMNDIVKSLMTDVPFNLLDSVLNENTNINLIIIFKKVTVVIRMLKSLTEITLLRKYINQNHIDTNITSEEIYEFVRDETNVECVAALVENPIATEKLTEALTVKSNAIVTALNTKNDAIADALLALNDVTATALKVTEALSMIQSNAVKSSLRTSNKRQLSELVANTALIVAAVAYTTANTISAKALSKALSVVNNVTPSEIVAKESVNAIITHNNASEYQIVAQEKFNRCFCKMKTLTKSIILAINESMEAEKILSIEVSIEILLFAVIIESLTKNHQKIDRCYKKTTQSNRKRSPRIKEIIKIEKRTTRSNRKRSPRIKEIIKIEKRTTRSNRKRSPRIKEIIKIGKRTTRSNRKRSPCIKEKSELKLDFNEV